MRATAIPLSHAQRALLAEAVDQDEAALLRHAADLAGRVVLLVRHRAVHDRDSAALLLRVEGLAAALSAGPADPAVRAAIWSLVEGLTHRPWGIGAQGAIDRLVVAGVIADALGDDA